jgi:hypothetical protein
LPKNSEALTSVKTSADPLWEPMKPAFQQFLTLRLSDTAKAAPLRQSTDNTTSIRSMSSHFIVFLKLSFSSIVLLTNNLRQKTSKKITEINTITKN